MSRPMSPTRQKVKALASQGFSQADIARQLGVSSTAIHQHFKGLGIKTPDQPSQARVKELLDKGLSAEQIQEALNFSRSNVHLLMRKVGQGVIMPPEEKKKKILALQAQGMTKAEVTRAMAPYITYTTVGTYWKELGLPMVLGGEPRGSKTRRAKALKQQGLSVREIATEMGVSYTAAYSLLNKKNTSIKQATAAS